MMVNCVDCNLELLIHEWDKSPTKDIQINNLKKSEIGNINNLGKASCATAIIFTKNHPDFFSSIETGIIELVLFLVNELNLVTFSSCEGHKEYFDHGDNIHTNFREREVSILPRDSTEHLKMLKYFRTIASKTNDSIKNQTIFIEVKEEILEQITKNQPNKNWINISIVFASITHDTLIYFNNLELVYKEFLANLTKYKDTYDVNHSTKKLCI